MIWGLPLPRYIPESYPELQEYVRDHNYLDTSGFSSFKTAVRRVCVWGGGDETLTSCSDQNIVVNSDKPFKVHYGRLQSRRLWIIRCTTRATF